MDEKPDSQLLRDYAEHRSEASFRELVHRYTDLVYSAALRQVNSADAARDVAQEVFTDLAAKAKVVVGKSAGEASLAGWLYRSTRFLALNHLRDERRRIERERQVMEQTDLTPAAEPEWERIRPVLDEAMSDLNETDRDALLLRFFKNRDFRAIGQSLGLSDDAAQKRVSRALEKLRAEFVRRGVTASALALSAALSTNAVTAAPAGCAAAFSSSALIGAAVTSAANGITTTGIAMSTIYKSIIVASLALTVGVGVHEARRTSEVRNQLRTLETQQQPLQTQIEDLQRERDRLIAEISILRDENARLDHNTAELVRLRDEVGRIRSGRTADQGAAWRSKDGPPILSSSITDMAWHYAQIRKKELSGVTLTAAEEFHLARAFPFIEQLDQPYEFAVFQAEYIAEIVELRETNTIWKIRRAIESGRQNELKGSQALRLSLERPWAIPPSRQSVRDALLPRWEDLDKRIKEEVCSLLSSNQQQRIALALPHVLMADPVLLQNPEDVARDPKFRALDNKQISDAWPERPGEARTVLARIPVSKDEK